MESDITRDLFKVCCHCGQGKTLSGDIAFSVVQSDQQRYSKAEIDGRRSTLLGSWIFGSQRSVGNDDRTWSTKCRPLCPESRMRFPGERDGT